MSSREVVANTFNRHDFAFCWSHAELAPCVTRIWIHLGVEQTGKAWREFVELIASECSTDGDSHQLSRRHGTNPSGFR